MNTTPDPVDPLDVDLQAEIDAALGHASLEDLVFEETPQPTGGKRPRREGVIVAVRDREALIEFGPKLQGVCPVDQFDQPPTVGARETFIIDREDRDSGILFCSRRGGVQKAQWDTIEIGQIIEARCTGTNTGGLEMDVAGHGAFMPAGHVELHHVADLSIFIGQKMPCEVIELDRQRNRMVLSRRAMLEAQRAEAKDTLLETLEVGQTLDAVVTRIQPYGAFADIGGIDGLIHVSELSWERIDDPGKVLKVGEAVRVQVLSIDVENDPPRIALGMKQLMADPLHAAMAGFNEGDVVEGTVTKIADFGAFVELSKGVDGLAHISELSHDRVKKVSDVVKVGQKVTVKVLSIDPNTRRIALSMKQAGGDGGQEFDRGEDPMIAKLKAKFGDRELKGGIG
ncbi:MAG: S1 RNA-binding domain-containing protein [Phycisphaerales bacterium]|nr:S1 RNA-binding domain-containing protein [Phycisphaerales bacterium]